MTEHEAYVALNMVPAMGGTTARAGVEAFGSAAGFLRAGTGEMVGVGGIGRVRAGAFREAFQTVDPAAEIAKAESCAVRIMTPDEDDWPKTLDSIPSPPIALYVAGSVEALHASCVAMVGTRGPTPYGREQARNFAYRLASAGCCIVSGLARGIDTEAAEGALLARGRTVAIVGSALDRLYPPENKSLARRIVASGGAVVSEYPFGRGADKQTFPMRNRLISGLSRGVLCVEAGLSSGTLITADHALEQGRPVMALPGRVSDPTAQGCLRLIKNGARLVESPEDVLDEISSLSLFAGSPPPAESARHDGRRTAFADRENVPEPQMTPEERKLVAALRDLGEGPADLVAAKAGISAMSAGPLLVSLEMKCMVSRAPTGLYSLRRSRP